MVNTTVSAMRSSEVGHERRHAAREVVEPRGKLPLGRALVDVRIPSADVGERHLETDIRLRQLCDLLQCLPERTAWILGPVCRLVLGRIGNLQHPDGVERFAASAVQHAIGRGRVLRFERCAERRLLAADAELPRSG